MQKHGEMSERSCDGKKEQTTPRRLHSGRERRWALSRGMPKEEGMLTVLVLGIADREMIELGIAEASIYGLAKDNTNRPRAQKLADFYVRDEYWPDFKLRHFGSALSWFERQDRTFGG